MPHLRQFPAVATNGRPAPAQLAEPPRVASRDLLRGAHLILIEHAGEHYYLRMTRNNKLILTK